MDAGERKLAAIMFTDIVGYTSLSERNEALAMQLLEGHRKVLRPCFPKHGGREVKTIGDAFLVEFESALEATRCAFEMQESLHEMNASRPLDKRFQIRIGIHLGDVIHEKDDVYGDAVNVASRIEPLAQPGGVCVSEQVYDQIKNKFEFPLFSLGTKELKNVGEPMEVFSVILPWEREGEGKQGLDPRRIAVLPFVNMSPDPRDEYVADGLTEEVIGSLSWIEGTNVVSRTSVMQYKNSKKSSSEIAKELGAGTLIEGSIRKSGDKVRITVQLIDAAKDEHKWVQSWDRHVQDIFDIQSDISRRIASSLKARFAAPPKAKAEPVQATTETKPAPQFKFCRFCGRKVPFQAGFCRHCGKQLTSIRPKVTES